MSKILLHACCGPCSLEPTRLLKAEGYDLAIVYSNANIQPRAEYEHRLDTLVCWANTQGITVLEGTYQPKEWMKRIGPAESWGSDHADRCRRCYRMRLQESAQMAAEGGFDGISTTLAVSPYQFSDIVHEELASAAASVGLPAIWHDFRPYYPEATRRSRALGMYRQNFCGCAFSNAEAAAEREERKIARAREKAQWRREHADEIAAAEAERQKKRAERAAYDAKQHRKKEALRAFRRAAKAQTQAKGNASEAEIRA
ncbi:MAG: epoxyqueuosine reductase QueH [Eggerthellaceae bacterium]